MTVGDVVYIKNLKRSGKIVDILKDNFNDNVYLVSSGFINDYYRKEELSVLYS
mgnify:CR=1 FL=1